MPHTFGARNQDGGLGAAHHPVVERLQRRQVQMVACLGKGPIGHAAQRHGAAANGGKEAIQRELLRLVAHRQQRANQRRQWQLSIARERLRMIRMPGPLRKLIRAHSRIQFLKQ